MKYEQLKEEIKSIAEIATTVPEPFRERCFELLLQHLLTSVSPAGKKKDDLDEAQAGDPPPPPPPPDQKSEKLDSGGNGTIPNPSQMKVFMQRTGITQADLERVLIYEDNAVHFVREPTGTKVARGQIEWSLLLALKNGIETNVLSADPEKIRSICQEKGFYDSANFGKNFKATSAAKLFQGLLEGQGEAQKLTPAGQDELARVIKTLATPAE